MFKNLLIAMDLSPASIRLIGFGLHGSSSGGGGTWRKRSSVAWRTTLSIGPRSLSSWCLDPSKPEGDYGMGWMCACGRENDDHSNECIECHNLRRGEQTEEDLDRLLEEELIASRKITTKLA